MKQLFNAPFNFYHNLAHGVRLVDDDGCSAIKESDVKPWALLDRFASNVNLDDDDAKREVLEDEKGNLLSEPKRDDESVNADSKSIATARLADRFESVANMRTEEEEGLQSTIKNQQRTKRVHEDLKSEPDEEYIENSEPLAKRSRTPKQQESPATPPRGLSAEEKGEWTFKRDRKCYPFSLREYSQ